MKKLTKALALTLAVTALSAPIMASTISLRVNNEFVTPTVAPFEQNGTTLVPLRIVSEKLGAKVDWDQKTKVITITQDETTIILTVGSKTAKVNGEAKELLLAPQVKNNTTMVPIRFVSENLNCTVGWDKASQVVSVNSKDVAVEEVNEGYKVTTFKNPKVIDGVVYLTEDQLEEAFGVKIEKVESHTVTITRKDFHCWLLNKDTAKSRNLGLGNGANRINWSYVALEDTNSEFWVKESGTIYYPVEYLSKYLNSNISYDSSSKELTITNKGFVISETVDSNTATLSGYVYYPDGTPVKGATVDLVTLEVIQFLTNHEVVTDENGYYEIKDFDTKKYPRVRTAIGIDGDKSKDGKSYIGTVPSNTIEGYDMEFGIYTNVNKLPDSVLYLKK